MGLFALVQNSPNLLAFWHAAECFHRAAKKTIVVRSNMYGEVRNRGFLQGEEIAGLSPSGIWSICLVIHCIFYSRTLQAVAP